VSDSNVPPDVLRLIARHVRSVEKLEILLQLKRAPQLWTPLMMARELRIDATSASHRLQELADEGFARREDDAYVYGAEGEVDRNVEQLARVYAERRVAVITAIFSQPNDQLQSFADAFRFTKGRS
jgi:hypothetical protein